MRLSEVRDARMRLADLGFQRRIMASHSVTYRCDAHNMIASYAPANKDRNTNAMWTLGVSEGSKHQFRCYSTLDELIAGVALYILTKGL